MTKPDTHKFHIPKTWLVKMAGDQLVVSGGADTSYTLDITDNLKTKFSAIKNDPYTVDKLSGEDTIIHEQLLAGGITVPVVNSKKSIKVRFFNSQPKKATYRNSTVVTTDDYDLGIIIYESGTFAELLQNIDYQQISKPHILFDSANYQNISFGPLVFPTETACLACLQGRLEYRWGDEQKPASPRANNEEKLLNAIIDREINRFIDGDYTLIGQTIALNFDDYTVVKHPLYKLDKCPICKKPEIDRLKNIA